MSNVVARALLLTLRALRIDIELVDVQRAHYPIDASLGRLHLEQASNLETLLAAEEKAFERENLRRDATEARARTLLTVVSIVFALIGLFGLAEAAGFTALWIFAVLAMLFSLMCVFLCLTVFAVGNQMTVTVRQEEVSLDNDNLKKSLINSYRLARQFNDSRTRYLIDVYRAARLSFLVSLVSLVAASAISVLSSAGNSSSAVVKELRGNPDLIDLLRGPKGERGSRGVPGRDAKVSTGAIVDELLKSKKLQALIREATRQEAPIEGKK